MNEAVSPGALSTLFTDARTHNGWRETPVSDETLQELYALMKWGPTSANCSPARIVFIRTAEGKERLRPALSSGNLQKTLTAPVTAIVAWDSEFYERLPQLFPHGDARKKGVVNVLTVKTRHRAGIQSQRPAGDDQIGRLHGTVAKRCFFGKLWAGGKPTAGITVGKQ